MYDKERIGTIMRDITKYYNSLDSIATAGDLDDEK